MQRTRTRGCIVWGNLPAPNHGIRTGSLHEIGNEGRKDSAGRKTRRDDVCGFQTTVSKEQKIRFYVNAHDFLESVRHLNVEWRNHQLKSAFRRRQWTAWGQGIRARATHYKSVGWSCKEIVSALRRDFRANIPYSTVHSWTSGNTVSWMEYVKAKPTPPSLAGFLPHSRGERDESLLGATPRDR